jgi:hypothetical protein
MFRITSIAIMVCLSAAAQAVPAAVREACVSDARRLCGAVIHDAALRHACMQSHRAELSTRCIDAVRASRMGGPGNGLYSRASSQAAISDCRMQYRGGRGSSIKSKDRPGWIEGCYLQKTWSNDAAGRSLSPGPIEPALDVRAEGHSRRPSSHAPHQ